MSRPKVMALEQRKNDDTRGVAIRGNDLTIEHLAAVARDHVRVRLSKDPRVRRRILASHELLREKIRNGEIIYGVSTGFGGNVRFLLPREDLARHQDNLFQFMVCGTGTQLQDDAVRAAMLLRANALTKGYSGVRPVVIDKLLELLNESITPVVPRYGSVGASGDLIPSAYIGRVLLGQGEVIYSGHRKPAKEALRQARIKPLQLEPKEGLALVNGTTVMTGIGALVVNDGIYLALLALACSMLTLEALLGSDDPFREEIHKLKNHPGQLRAAALCRRLLRGSRYARSLDDVRTRLGAKRQATPHEITRCREAIQNPYSLRCVPQGLGPALDGLHEHKQTIEREMNSVNDNPLVDADQGCIYHTGNFYGGHVARALDSWKIDLATIGNWLHAQMAMVVDDRFSNGLPPNLAPKPGLFTGFKGMQLSLTSLVCTLRHLANPSMIHPLPTEQYNQDMVSLGTHAALTALDMTEILQDATAISLITLCQAIDLREGEKYLGEGTRRVYETVRGKVTFVDHDRCLDVDIAAVKKMIKHRAIPINEEGLT